ncbi:FtsK/SpoIIIE domain-containing protein [Heyndrickxia sp. FSL W8-0496]|uniref:FtsK/SpoIIIE domain-containing protein n=1 Tax=Heyndrickxia sp. FSL W8-0496 TaxID=2954702 RepID=UPI0030FCC83D
MIFEALTTLLMGGIGIKAYLSKSGVGNESDKIQKIFTVTGLNIKDGKQTYTTQLIRKRDYDWGTEYRYRIPLGRSFDDYIAKQEAIEAGINNRTIKIDLKDLQNIKLDRDILSNIKSIYTKKLSHRKEVELSYDGILKIRVYKEPLPKKILWKEDFLRKGSWSVLIGMNYTEKIYHDFDERKHLIVAGATGFGKSVIIKGIITSLTLSKANDVSFSLIDLKGGPAFARFKNLKQVVNFGVNNDDALDILKDVQRTMSEDYQKIVDDGFEDVVEAGIKRRHFLVIDEAADIADDNKCMTILTDIVRKGRGAGYYVIYATQYPSAQAIPMQIKRNIPARLCFVLDSATASNTVLDGAGAESLPEIPGRGIYKQVKQTIIQTPYLSNERIKELIEPYIIDKGGNKIETAKQETRSDTLIFEETGLS